MSVIFALIFFGAFLGFATWLGNSPVSGHDGICMLQQGYCKHDTAGLTVSLQIAPTPIPLEEELQLDFGLPKQSHIRQAWIEGINMYMGRIPVIFEPSQRTSSTPRGSSFLGSCSEANMLWQLTAIVDSPSNSASTPVFFQFKTKSQ